MSTSYPTPVYSHVGRGDFTDVYEPAEDTFLLMDALEKDAETLQRVRWLNSVTVLKHHCEKVKNRWKHLSKLLKKYIIISTLYCCYSLGICRPLCALYINSKTSKKWKTADLWSFIARTKHIHHVGLSDAAWIAAISNASLVAAMPLLKHCLCLADRVRARLLCGGGRSNMVE